MPTTEYWEHKVHAENGLDLTTAIRERNQADGKYGQYPGCYECALLHAVLALLALVEEMQLEARAFYASQS